MLVLGCPATYSVTIAFRSWIVIAKAVAGDQEHGA